MRRVVSVYLPTWPTDRIRRQNGAPPLDEPLVTAATEGSRRIIAAADAAARSLGLQPGMTVAHAQALVPNLHIVEAAPDADDVALRKLATWCMGYSPLVAADPPDGIWIDIAGSAHLFGGEAKLIDDLARRLNRTGSTQGPPWQTHQEQPGRWPAMARSRWWPQGGRSMLWPVSRPLP